MGEPDRQSRLGRIEWFDLTVDNASDVCEFYKQVVGWESSPLSMGDYDDYCVGPTREAVTAGICHKRGPNANFPSAWMVYINVDDLDASLKAVAAGGGQVLGEVRSVPGQGRFCVIQDPAGAVCSLFEPPRDSE